MCDIRSSRSFVMTPLISFNRLSSTLILARHRFSDVLAKAGSLHRLLILALSWIVGVLSKYILTVLVHLPNSGQQWYYAVSIRVMRIYWLRLSLSIFGLCLNIALDFGSLVWMNMLTKLETFKDISLRNCAASSTNHIRNALST